MRYIEYRFKIQSPVRTQEQFHHPQFEYYNTNVLQITIACGFIFNLAFMAFILLHFFL